MNSGDQIQVLGLQGKHFCDRAISLMPVAWLSFSSKIRCSPNMLPPQVPKDSCHSCRPLRGCFSSKHVSAYLPTAWSWAQVPTSMLFYLTPAIPLIGSCGNPPAAKKTGLGRINVLDISWMETLDLPCDGHSALILPWPCSGPAKAWARVCWSWPYMELSIPLQEWWALLSKRNLALASQAGPRPSSEHSLNSMCWGGGRAQLRCSSSGTIHIVFDSWYINYAFKYYIIDI